MSHLGRVEKSVDAHHGAAISTRWSPDGTGLLTCKIIFTNQSGEDGTVKMWSRNGMLRSVLVQLPVPIHW
uniref:WD_REPEATS_REGION domain-containing protein n=1 Tax=Heterorhabditis bacteriophora TaxID=37862 RepID=A0A1I7XJK1_HETBA